MQNKHTLWGIYATLGISSHPAAAFLAKTNVANSSKRWARPLAIDLLLSQPWTMHPWILRAASTLAQTLTSLPHCFCNVDPDRGPGQMERQQCFPMEGSLVQPSFTARGTTGRTATPCPSIEIFHVISTQGWRRGLCAQTHLTSPTANHRKKNRAFLHPQNPLTLGISISYTDWDIVQLKITASLFYTELTGVTFPHSQDLRKGAMLCSHPTKSGCWQSSGCS